MWTDTELFSARVKIQSTQLFICGTLSINRRRVTTVEIEVVVQLCPVQFFYHACLSFLLRNWSWGLHCCF